MRKKFTLVASLAFAAALCAGVAAANVTAQAETDWVNDLKVSATSVRLGTGTKEDPTGIRFKIDCPVDLRTNENAEYYTTISFTADKAYTTNVPATYWRADASGWNTLLLEIPSQYYTMDITATAVVKLDGETYTATATSSIAKTASIVMNGGQKDAKLDAFVAGAVTDITLSEATATLQEGETAQLTATTAPAGYGVVWASDAEEVATVAPDGTITAVSAGTANITATMSGVTKTCVVTVKGRTLYDFESAEQVALADNFLGCGSTATDITTWAIAEDVGAVGNSALQKTDDKHWSRGMQLRMASSYLETVFETYDAIEFDFYTNINESVTFQVQDLKTNDQGKLAENSPKAIGTLTGVAEGSLYKYSVVLAKGNFESVAYSTGNFVLKFLFASSTPNTWYIDNFKFVEPRSCYDFETADQIGFSGNILGCGATGADATTWAIAENVGTAGNHALQKTDNSQWSRGMQLRVKSSYLATVFETYDSITFDIYTNINEQVKYTVENGVSADTGTIGNFTGTAVGSLYKYSFTLTKANFSSRSYAKGECILKFLFASSTPNTWYIDNFTYVANNA